MVQIEVVRAATPVVRELLTEYFALRAAGFPAEMGTYRTPTVDASAFQGDRGTFLLARDDEGQALAIGGIRLIEAAGEPVAEVKHLFVRERARGLGLARTIMAQLEDAARAFGVRRIVLDTNKTQQAAVGLYTALGYRSVAPYNDNANANLWFERRLGAESAGEGPSEAP